jgi:hypothetical protein
MTNSGGGGRPGRTNRYAKEQAQKKKQAHYDLHKYDGSDPGKEVLA